MSLQEQGFRFVLRGANFRWLHFAETEISDVDCTDMTDAQFEKVVESVPTPTCKQCGWYVAPGTCCDRCGNEVAGSLPADVGISGSGPTKKGENGCSTKNTFSEPK